MIQYLQWIYCKPIKWIWVKGDYPFENPRFVYVDMDKWLVPYFDGKPIGCHFTPI